MDQADVNRMFEAIEDGKVDVARQLLRKHPDLLPVYFIGGGTWLHQAASQDHVPMVEMLVAAGLDVNVPRKADPDSPLNEAARNCKRIRQLSVAELLAETMRRINAEESVSSLFVE